MSSIVLRFQEIDKSKISVVGGKGANLGEMSRMEGIHVPDGFCISTEAFQRIIGKTRSLNELLEKLAFLRLEDRDKIRELSSEIRTSIEGIVIPEDVNQEISSELCRLGEIDAYAVRSSATAEDLPLASFAGQLDTYLNVIGKEAILKHLSKCWASLFTDRAVTYRLQNGIDHRKVQMSVIVQKMVLPQAAGILFTADPVTSNRQVVSIDASFGLGDALASGLVNPDNYKVRQGKLIDKQLSTRQLAVYALAAGGTKTQQIEPEQQNRQALTDVQILQLEQLGRKIEAHFGQPQDIEWCLAEDTFYFVQSRPITTLFPIPKVNDQEKHLYISVGHQQMMTDPIKPLGLSVWQLTAGRPMFTAGGRLFVDIAGDLASPVKRNMLVNVLGKSDPIIKDALTTILEQRDFIKTLPVEEPLQASGNSKTSTPPAGFQTLQDYDPAVVSDLIQERELSLKELIQNIQTKTGSELFDFIREDGQQRKQSLSDQQSFGVIMTGMNAASWINEKMMAWLGEKNVADTLAQSVPNNITSEMGLALLDVADVIRPFPEVIHYLQKVKVDDFLDELLQFEGGQETRATIAAFLEKYGMRCSGEIDVTRTRWSEKPSTLIPLILSNIKNFEPGESQRKFEKGLQEALNKELEIVARLKQLPDGEQKVAETKRMIHLVRHFAGYREYPKYSIVNRFFVYKQALLKEAEQLVQARLIHEKEDIYYLTMEEFRDAVCTHQLDKQIIRQRKEAYKLYAKLTPPRVMTSEGEIIAGVYKRENLPEGALIGLAVSAGVTEGRARVIFNIEDADLEPEDILVTTFTDPSWTPLFVSIKGLVTEVGGLMTHGAVIAREYGLPAVVGMENATRLIQDGQRIRVNGTDGYVEILDSQGVEKG